MSAVKKIKPGVAGAAQTPKTGVKRGLPPAGAANRLAALQVIIRNLKNERAKLFRETGMKLWALRREQKRNEAQAAFDAIAVKMAALQALITATEKEAAAIGPVE